MGDYGIGVSYAGHDAKTAADKYMSLKTNMNLLKVVVSGNASFSGNTQISHNLGYVPQFLVWMNNGTYSYFSTGHVSFGMAFSDTTKLYLKSGYLGAVTAKYYIFYEQA